MEATQRKQEVRYLLIRERLTKLKIFRQQEGFQASWESDILDGIVEGYLDIQKVRIKVLKQFWIVVMVINNYSEMDL